MRGGVLAGTFAEETAESQGGVYMKVMALFSTWWYTMNSGCHYSNVAQIN